MNIIKYGCLIKWKHNHMNDNNIIAKMYNSIFVYLNIFHSSYNNIYKKYNIVSKIT